MGWSEFGDGYLSSDTSADDVAAVIERIAKEARRRSGKLPAGRVLLDAVVQALNLDGSSSPFYAEKWRLEALVVQNGGKRVRCKGDKAEAWIVAEVYEMLESVAEDYTTVCQRAPHVRELLHYLASHLEEEEIFASNVSDASPWNLRDAKIVYQKEKKPKDRSPAPDVESTRGARGRVKHPKFGEGAVLEENGDRLTVKFGAETRIVMRSFVTPVT